MRRSRRCLRHGPEVASGEDRAARRQDWAPHRAGIRAMGRTPSPAPSHGLGQACSPRSTKQSLRPGERGQWEGTSCQGNISLHTCRDTPLSLGVDTSLPLCFAPSSSSQGLTQKPLLDSERPLKLEQAGSAPDGAFSKQWRKESGVLPKAMCHQCLCPGRGLG